MQQIQNDNHSTQKLTLEQMEEASNYVINSGICRRTPFLRNIQHCLEPITNNNGNETDRAARKLAEAILSCNLHFKMENMQNGRCFKMRGVANQMRMILERQSSKTEIDHVPVIKPKLLTFSGGNYGKCFSILAKKFGFHGSTVVMPKTAPMDRVNLIESNGCVVKRVPTSDIIKTLEELLASRSAPRTCGGGEKVYDDESNSKQQVMKYLDPFDDFDLISAYGGIAFEILEEIPVPDIVLVPCGGGGLLSGMASGLRLKLEQKGIGQNVKIYGVEPVTSNVMFNSFRDNKPAILLGAQSIATGLCSPYAGKITFELCRKFVDDILLIEDSHIKQAVEMLYALGFLIEPSGAAGLAALLAGKISPRDLENKNVVVVLSGGNISLDDMSKLLQS